MSERAKSIFLEAIEGHAPEGWAVFADAACGGDVALRAEVERLLAAQVELGTFRESPPTGKSPTVEAPSPSERPGAVIGPYKLIQEIGVGGMGAVFLAQQHEPVKRLVALKVIKAGMDSCQVVARFEAERQALALMDHPNIAKVLDAGTTPEGRPYFVMELVKGVPITAYCDEHHLTPRQRLGLFVSVCQAVQHAHQKGIIHRDLKPSNVLVAPYDGEPVVKVIDFGVAKAVGQPLTESTLVTGIGAVVGTPEYMSPEQAELNNRDIDTRSDIYSLGVLLFELLTGSTPLTRKRLKDAAILEVLRLIREVEPPRPSTRLSSTEELPSIAASRGLEPRQLSALVRGDLDWIAMKALEKDRNRRYESANGFAMDVRRYLSDEAVLACPPSAWYRLRKFVRRHKVGLTAGTLVAVALVLGTVVSLWQAVRAVEAGRLAREKHRLAEENFQKARQAVDESFTLVSESKLFDAPGLQPLRKELMEAALRYYQGMLDQRTDDPAVLADLAATSLRVGLIYHALDRNDDCVAAVEAALPLAERLRRDFPDSVTHHRQLAGTFRSARSQKTEMPKDPARARRALTRLLDLWKAFARASPSVEEFQYDIAFINHLLAILEGGRGKASGEGGLNRAIAHCREAIAILEQQRRANPEVADYHRELLAHAYSYLAWVLTAAGRAEEAQQSLAMNRREVDELAARFPDDPSNRAKRAIRAVADAKRLAVNQPQEAERVLNDALQVLGKLVADFPAEPHYRTGLGDAHLQHAKFLAGALKRPDDAARAYRRGLEQLESAVAAQPQSIRLQSHLGWSYREAAAYFAADPKRMKEAYDFHRRDISIFERLAKDYPDDPRTSEQVAHAYRLQGFAMQRSGRNPDAEAALRSAIHVLEGSTTAFPKAAAHRELLADTCIGLAELMTHDKRFADAEWALKQALAAYDHLAADDPARPSYWLGQVAGYRRQARLMLSSGQALGAATCYQRLLGLDAKLPAEIRQGADHRNELAGALIYVGLALEAGQLRREAEEAHSKAMALWDQLCEEDPAEGLYRQKRAQFSLNLGTFLQALGRPGDAVAHCRAGTRLNEQLVKDFPDKPDHRARLGQARRALISLLASLSRDEELGEEVEALLNAPPSALELNSIAWSLCSSSNPSVGGARWAVELAQKGTELDPNGRYLFNTLGVAHYRTGDWAAAIQALQRSRARNQNSYFSWDAFFLAMAYWRLGDRDEARTWYDRAVVWMQENQPKNEELRRFRFEAAGLLGVAVEVAPPPREE